MIKIQLLTILLLFTSILNAQEVDVIEAQVENDIAIAKNPDIAEALAPNQLKYILPFKPDSKKLIVIVIDYDNQVNKALVAELTKDLNRRVNPEIFKQLSPSERKRFVKRLDDLSKRVTNINNHFDFKFIDYNNEATGLRKPLEFNIGKYNEWQQLPNYEGLKEIGKWTEFFDWLSNEWFLPFKREEWEIGCHLAMRQYYKDEENRRNHFTQSFFQYPENVEKYEKSGNWGVYELRSDGKNPDYKDYIPLESLGYRPWPYPRKPEEPRSMICPINGFVLNDVEEKIEVLGDEVEAKKPRMIRK